MGGSEYDRVGEVGGFGEEKVELIEGVLGPMSAQGKAQAVVRERIGEMLEGAGRGGAGVGGQGPPGGAKMRGSGAASQPSAKAEQLTVTAGAAGACTVSWLAMPGAESYVVEVLDPLFAVVHSEHPGAALTCTLDANAIGSGTYVRVIALRQSDRILEQGPMALPGK